MSTPTDHPSDGDDPQREPEREQLQEPSTEKDPGEEPKAPAPHDPAPDHEAVGIGVIDDPPPPTP